MRRRHPKTTRSNTLCPCPPLVRSSYLIGRILSHDVIEAETGELLASANDEITEETLEAFRKAGIDGVGTIWVNDLDRGAYLSNTLRIDSTKRSEERRVGKEWVSTCRSRWSP